LSQSKNSTVHSVPASFPAMRLAPLLLLLALAAQSRVSVLTYRNDLARTGANLSETVLMPGNVNAAQFGKILAFPVDGQIYGQPLYLPAVRIPGKGPRNVVYVATQHNSVYAFDANAPAGADPSPLWHVSLMNAAAGETPVSSEDAMNCMTITPEIGITGTPVIDPLTNTLYVVTLTESNAIFAHRLHALDAATGAERPGSPIAIDATVPGTGGDLFAPSPVKFLTYFHKNRAGLLLLNGVVYAGFASHCDSRSYHGWLLGYSTTDLHQASVFNTTPNGYRGAFWMGGAAPAADEAGTIYVISGNGKFNADGGGTELGDSVIRLSSPGLALVDYFTPFNQQYLDDADIDLGSSGALLLPDSAGTDAHRHLLVTAGKEGRIYLLDRDRLGRFQAGSDSQIVQSIQGAIGPLFGGGAYFGNTVYFAASNDRLKAFPISQARIANSPSSQSSQPLGYPGAVPSISANQSANGIVWLVEGSYGGILRAFDATNLANELYNSQINSARDALGAFVRFSVPTIAEGRVYVGNGKSLVIYGLLEQTSTRPVRR
jgi:hypothetical protein